MEDPRHALITLLKKDKRYRFEAYAFVFEALSYAHDKLNMGTDYYREETEAEGAEEYSASERVTHAAEPAEHMSAENTSETTKLKTERHLSGQELCQAIRIYALEQFGLMAKCVLNSWGLRQTADFGEIVFNLIAIRQMRKTRHDRREDFDNVYDFDQAFVREFKITDQ
ncbi:MAG: hypothetical protein SFX18_06085 [Pirellulales bacterium]|nr:hypothetical protein [Pirellulales bacterium]